jgi:hypothetical protein
MVGIVAIVLGMLMVCTRTTRRPKLMVERLMVERLTVERLTVERPEGS